MDPTQISNLLRGLAAQTGNIEFQENRARTTHADRLRSLAATKLAQQRAMAESFADRGLAHSGVASASQINLARAADEQRARLNQDLNDQLANAARRKIDAQANFNIASLIPR